MAPSRGRGKAKVYPLGRSPPAQSMRRSGRSRTNQNGVSDVYKDMLAEASANDTESIKSDRPLKRRKVAGVEAEANRAKRNIQTVQDSSASDNSNDSEFDFEDVDLDQPNLSSPAAKASDNDGIADVSVAVDTSKVPKRTQVAKRKAASPAEKAHRLLVHKLHILCLLGHVMYVNTWCNDSVAQQLLLEILPEKTQSYLAHNSEHSQFQQNRSFMDGLQQATELWRGAFKINASGMHRAKWSDADSVAQDGDVRPLDKAEFRRAAQELDGSQDMGNQLFCAMLRAVGVEVRIVCSLQVVPFGSSAKDKSSTPTSELKKKVYAMASGNESPATGSNTEDAAMRNSTTVGKVPSARRRLGQPSLAATSSLPTVTPTKKRPVRKLTYPIFWVEAFNQAHQTWIPVDPLVTQTIGKASKLEPPGSSEWNQMSYVIAFESDGVARDVTKRYTKAYNAKTRRLRVESAESNGAAWLKRALRTFRRPRFDDKGRDRDQIEDSQLAQREAQEGLPNNVQDFKHHPYYALERHLRRHEVIHPRREVGKVNAGTAAKPRMEAVFRRSDVQACKSADKWFRVGREIKESEQPLKRVPARRIRNARAASDDEDEQEAVSPLYALFQTKLYVPPPVLKGKVPRNAYGNLDIYVPSMVPPGGAHVRHPLAKEAARVVKVDAVDAVTGFKFQGRQGTAVVEGVVVAAEHKDAVEAAIESLQDDQAEQDGMARSALALKMWRRFLTALRIKERVSAYGDGTAEEQSDMDMKDTGDGEANAAGGFLAEDTVTHGDHHTLPTAGRFSLAELLDATSSRAARTKRPRVKHNDESVEAESSHTDGTAEEDGGFEPTTRSERATRSKRKIVDDNSEDEDNLHMSGALPQVDGQENEGGGFLPEDDMGGGFVPATEDVSDTVGTQANESGGGFMVEDEEGFAAQRQILDDERDDDADTDQTTGVQVDQSIGPEHATDVHMRDGSPLPALQTANPPHNEEERSGDVTAHILDTAANDTITQSDPSQPSNQQAARDASQQVQWHFRGLEQAQQHTSPDEADDNSDRGSMLSHDPDDEDAEPDWLESD